MKKVQFTMDDETIRLMEALAVPRAGNKSFVVREAVRRMAEQDLTERNAPASPFRGGEAGRYAGEWVALSGQDVVAHGRDGVAVFHEARGKGVPVPRLVRVPDVAEDQAIFGL